MTWKMNEICNCKTCQEIKQNYDEQTALQPTPLQ